MVTGEARYEQQYWDISPSAMAKTHAREAYHRIYWDFVAAGQDKLRPDGAKAPLLEPMKRCWFQRGGVRQAERSQGQF